MKQRHCDTCGSSEATWHFHFVDTVVEWQENRCGWCATEVFDLKRYGASDWICIPLCDDDAATKHAKRVTCQ